MSGPSPARRHGPPPVGSWRVTTAARVFVVALTVGQTLSAGSLGAVGVILVALGLLAALSCAVEADAVLGNRWAPLAEGVLAAALLGVTDAPVEPLLVYLAVPPVVAGIRYGWVATLNVALAIGIALVGAYAAADSLGSVAPQVVASLPWLLTGLGTGLLASWLTRSVRELEESQAPFAAAHRLLSQLHTLSQRLPVKLDSRSVAENLVDTLHHNTTASRVSLWNGSDVAPRLMAQAGRPCARPALEAEIALRSWTRNRPVQDSGLLALPMRVGEHTLGAVVLTTGLPSRDDLERLQRATDEHALKLDTAMLFEEVREIATTEERNRLAREIHDGVAQEIACIGYLVDDLAAEVHDPRSRQAAVAVREEVSRVVNELRLSIFDLRTAVDEAGGLAAALSDHARQVGAQSGLHVHVSLEGDDAALHPTVCAELLRVSQEAISNVRKHARARNLWVTLVVEGQHAVLRVEDDGVGAATERPHHYGLQTMRERAASIGARLTVGARSGGGTFVAVDTREPEPPTGGGHHVRTVDQSAARR